METIVESGIGNGMSLSIVMKEMILLLKAFKYHTKMDLVFLGVLTGDEQVINIVIGKCQAM